MVITSTIRRENSAKGKTRPFRPKVGLLPWRLRKGAWRRKPALAPILERIADDPFGNVSGLERGFDFQHMRAVEHSLRRGRSVAQPSRILRGGYQFQAGRAGR